MLFDIAIWQYYRTLPLGNAIGQYYWQCYLTMLLDNATWQCHWSITLYSKILNPKIITVLDLWGWWGMTRYMTQHLTRKCYMTMLLDNDNEQCYLAVLQNVGVCRWVHWGFITADGHKMLWDHHWQGVGVEGLFLSQLWCSLFATDNLFVVALLASVRF